MSFPRYPHYKDSGVEWLGEVPEHWRVLQGRRLFEQRKDPVLSTDEQLSATQKYGVVPQQKFMEAEDQKVTLALSGTGLFKHVETDDFVISLRSFQGGIEHSAYTGCVSPAYTVLRPVRDIYPRYWAYALKSEGFISALQSVTDGIRDGKNVSYQQFGGLLLPLCPLSEQVTIAGFLNREVGKIDALTAEQQRLIELLKEKRQAVISHAVTRGLNPDAPMKPSGVEWLGDVPAHWEVQRVKTVSTFTTSGPRGWSDRVGDDGALFIQSGDLDDELRIRFAGAKRVRVEDGAEATRTKLLNGDVVVCITGAKTGNVAVCAEAPEDAYVNQHLCLVRPAAEVHSAFLGHLLKSDIGQSYFSVSQYGLKQGLSLEDVREAPVLIPPMPEQVAIVEYISLHMAEFSALLSEVEKGIVLLQERRTSLISAAVTGKIDVRGVARTEAA